MNRRTFVTTLSIGTVAMTNVAGCLGIGDSNGESQPVDGTLVKMSDSSRFEPETVTIPVGETVVWRNTGYAEHTVTAYESKIPSNASYFASGDFSSEQTARDGYSQGKGTIGDGGEFEHKFDIPGRYEYFCIPHESSGMTGTVIVEDESTSTTNENASAFARPDAAVQE